MKRQSMAVACFLSAFFLAHAEPPPFGTVIEQWSLEMSGSYAGSGMTWVRDSGKFYLMDQGYAGTIRVWNLEPADPEGSIAQVPWTFANLGMATQDIPWGIAWDNDSGCFWVSQIKDGDIYGGCYLLRHIWNGESWVWGGTARDSWLVGNGSNGGGLRCLWLAGTEKWYDRGFFIASPVHSSPPPDTYGFALFDPYTKTNLGRLACSDSIGARGVTLIPWDSAYIVTCGWSSGFVKLDTLGRILQRADSSRHAASDMAVMWPRPVYPDDTVCIYLMTSSSPNTFLRISTGMLWRQLPSAFEHSVRPDKMLAPVWLVDSGETVVPLLVVRNDADVTAENVSVHLLIDNEADRIIYHDSLVVTLAPRSSDTLEFSSWTATGRDSMGATTWTYWVHDRHRSDDTLSARFLVRVQDVGITAVNSPIPGDTIDPDTVYPSCVVSNHGNITVTVPMVFNIGPYWDTVRVQNLIAGGSRPATADRPWVASRGVWRCLMKAEVDRDLHPENNDTTFIFYVRETITHDIRFEAICPPADTQLVGDTVRPMVRVANYGTQDEEFWMYFRVVDVDSATTYLDSAPVILPVGGNTHVAFAPLVLDEPGWFAWACSAYVDSSCVVVVRDEFWVIDPVGMHEQGPKPLAFGISVVRPNPFSVRTVVRFGLPGQCGVDIAVFSADGRRVKRLTRGVLGVGYHQVVWDGRDDAGRNVSRGVYCLRLAAGGHVVNRRIVKLE
jgi:hypothetical protein